MLDWDDGTRARQESLGGRMRWRMNSMAQIRLGAHGGRRQGTSCLVEVGISNVWACVTALPSAVQRHSGIVGVPIFTVQHSVNMGLYKLTQCC